MNIKPGATVHHINARRLPRREIDRKRAVFINIMSLVAGLLIGGGLVFLFK